MKTITLSIGNSDNKLTQEEWAAFVKEIQSTIDDFATAIYFFGGPANWEPFQNVSWVFELGPFNVSAMKDRVSRIRKKYRQDSLAWVEGVTEFV